MLEHGLHRLSAIHRPRHRSPVPAIFVQARAEGQVGELTIEKVRRAVCQQCRAVGARELQRRHGVCCPRNEAVPHVSLPKLSKLRKPRALASVELAARQLYLLAIVIVHEPGGAVLQDLPQLQSALDPPHVRSGTDLRRDDDEEGPSKHRAVRSK
eukprot:scaffold84891_cov66-Phaeocystis_antarctica.AAC.5